MPAVHRNGDLRACGASTVVVGQGTVFANGLPVSVINDPSSHGGGTLLATTNNGTVFAGGLLVNPIGSLSTPDALCNGNPHCAPTAIIGSPNVNACG